MLGNLFHEVIVSALFSAVDRTTDVRAALAAAEAAGAITRRAGSRWGFIHALYRDTAYEGLPFRQRQQLHRLAAEIIEERAADRQAVASLLSLHYSAARAHEPAWKYSLIAADAAEAQNATSEAAAALERALASGRYCRSLTGSDRAAVAERLGDFQYVLGRFVEADRALETARRSTTELQRDVQLMGKIGLLRERQGQPKQAINWFRRALHQVPAKTTDRAWLGQRAELLLSEAGLRARQGDDGRCVELARSALVDAGLSEAANLTALALERIHLGQVGLGQPDDERCGIRALEEYERLDDHNGMSRVLNNLGVAAYYDSKWAEAVGRYLEAIEAANRAGNVVLAANAAVNSAEVLGDQGHWARSLELFDDALRNYQAVGYHSGAAAVRLFSAVSAMRDGQLKRAAAGLTEARDSLTRLGADLLPDLAAREVEFAVLTGDADEAMCIAVVAKYSDELVTLRTQRCRGIIVHLRDGGGDAQSILEAALAQADPAGFERAITLAALRLVAPGAPSQAAWKSEIDEITSQLGIVRLPPLVPSDLIVVP